MIEVASENGLGFGGIEHGPLVEVVGGEFLGDTVADQVEQVEGEGRPGSGGGFRIGRFGARAILAGLDLLEEAVDHAQVVVKVRVEGGSEPVQEAHSAGGGAVLSRGPAMATPDQDEENCFFAGIVSSAAANLYPLTFVAVGQYRGLPRAGRVENDSRRTRESMGTEEGREADCTGTDAKEFIACRSGGKPALPPLQPKAIVSLLADGIDQLACSLRIVRD